MQPDAEDRGGDRDQPGGAVQGLRGAPRQERADKHGGDTDATDVPPCVPAEPRSHDGTALAAVVDTMSSALPHVDPMDTRRRVTGRVRAGHRQVAGGPATWQSDERRLACAA
nr:hypothetical protein GCM10020092_059280 [Actinoplanes digitatis]